MIMKGILWRAVWGRKQIFFTVLVQIQKMNFRPNVAAERGSMSRSSSHCNCSAAGRRPALQAWERDQWISHHAMPPEWLRPKASGENEIDYGVCVLRFP